MPVPLVKNRIIFVSRYNPIMARKMPLKTNRRILPFLSLHKAGNKRITDVRIKNQKI